MQLSSGYEELIGIFMDDIHRYKDAIECIEMQLKDEKSLNAVDTLRKFRCCLTLESEILLNSMLHFTRRRS